MNPGPATPTDATFSSCLSLAAMASANSRGFLPASLAKTIAAFVAMSPWVGSFGGSTTTRVRINTLAQHGCCRGTDARKHVSEQMLGLFRKDHCGGAGKGICGPSQNIVAVQPPI